MVKIVDGGGVSVKADPLRENLSKKRYQGNNNDVLREECLNFHNPTTSQ